MSESQLPAEVEKSLKTIGDDVKGVIEKANVISIANDNEMTVASDFLTQVKKEIKAIDNKRKEYVTPLKETAKKIDHNFKIRIEPLEQAERMIKKKMEVYIDKKEKEAAEEQAKLKEKQRKEEEKAQAKLEAAKESGDENKIAKAEAKLEEKQNAEPQAVEAPKTSFRTESGTVSAKKIWDFEILDVNKIPREYLAVNEKAIRLAIANGHRQIEGLRIFQRTSIAGRT